MFLNLLQNVSGALKNNPLSWTSLILWASLRKDKARIQSSSQLQRYLWQCFLENLVNSLYDPQMSAETETRSSPQASKLSCCTDEACLFLFLLPVGIQIHIVFISARGGEKICIVGVALTAHLLHSPRGADLGAENWDAERAGWAYGPHSFRRASKCWHCLLHLILKSKIGHRLLTGSRKELLCGRGSL